VVVGQPVVGPVLRRHGGEGLGDGLEQRDGAGVLLDGHVQLIPGWVGGGGGIWVRGLGGKVRSSGGGSVSIRRVIKQRRKRGENKAKTAARRLGAIYMTISPSAASCKPRD